MCAEVNWRIRCFSRPKAIIFCVAYRKDREVDVLMLYISRLPRESLGGEDGFSSSLWKQLQLGLRSPLTAGVVLLLTK